MSEKTEKARPGVAAPGRAIEEKAACEGASLSMPYCTPQAPPRQSENAINAEKNICDLLAHGAERGIKADELCVLSNCQTRRELRRRIAEERQKGALILASVHGYFLPSEDAEQAQRELAAYVRQAERKARSIFAALQCSRRVLSQCPCAGQTKIPEVSADAETKSG